MKPSISNSCLILPAVVKQQQGEISRNHVPSLFGLNLQTCPLVLSQVLADRKSEWSDITPHESRRQRRARKDPRCELSPLSLARAGKGNEALPRVNNSPQLPCHQLTMSKNDEDTFCSFA